MNQISSEPWFIFLSDWQKKLVELALELYENESKLKHNYCDYSFIIFPMSKAYEGFLKKWLFSLRLINQKVYEGKRFRIGRALNPDLPHRLRDEYWLYDDIVKRCGPDSGRFIWDTWLQCRNQVFHFFPKGKGSFTLKEARERLDMVIEAMTLATEDTIGVIAKKVFPN